MHPARTTSWTPARISAPGQHVRRLAGWGRNASSAATVVAPQPGQDIARSVQDAGSAGLIARGCGRSYGDAALCAGGTVLDMTGVDRILEFDAGSGLLVAEAGATLSRIIAQTHPRGWLPPVLPGTAFVTLGGAVASDVHGKNHVSAGSFGRHVQWLDLLTADLSVIRLSPRLYPEQFWTTVGGMGLTGVILTVCLQLRSAAGAMLRQQQRARSFGEVLESMDRAALRQLSDPGLHAIAWIDALAPGSAMGRGVVETACLLGTGTAAAGGRTRPGPELPSLPGPGLISTLAIRAVNSVRWHRSRNASWKVTSVRDALQPLDRIEVWPAAFGRDGLVQCQVAVPHQAAPRLHQMLTLANARGVPPVLVTLKRFGTASPAPLSFPIPGWTMAMDFPARWPGLGATLDEVEMMAADAGGRVYLTKDSRVAPGSLGRMYPRLHEWRRIRDAIDPAGTFVSDLGRRLGLVARRTGRQELS